MYRQWRECTKALISGRTPHFKKHIQITEEYLLYARSQLAKNSHLGKEYQQNHGIIKLRDDFLVEKNLKGSDIIRQEYSQIGGAPADVSDNVILVPIATLGCGKTTVALALTRLFGWGHVQNDNITGKGRPPRFTREVLTQLEDKAVVVADRNNAQKHERKQIIEDIHRTHPHVRLVALHYVHSPEALARIREVTRTRVKIRGDNHQTIQAESDPNKVIGIMEGFINRFEPLNPDSPPDDGFEAVINLDPAADSRENLEIVVGQLHNMFPKLFTDMPTNEDLDDAIAFALSDYKPELRHEIGDPNSGRDRNRDRGGKKNQRQQDVSSTFLPLKNLIDHPQTPQPAVAKKSKPLEYVSITLPKSEILDLLDSTFSALSSNKARFYRFLQENHRVQPEFHVTLIHRASAKQNPEVWAKYEAMHNEAGGDPWAGGSKMGDCDVLLERVVWDNRIMAIVARVVGGDGGEEWVCTNSVAHVTVGLRGDDIKPKESNDLLRRWIEVGSGDESGIGEAVVEGRRVVHGIVNGVLSR